MVTLVECSFERGPVNYVLAGSPSSFELLAVAFGDPEVFGVPAGLLGGPTVLGVFYRCDGVCAVRGPGVSYTVVQVAGGFRLVGGECVDPFVF